MQGLRRSLFLVTLPLVTLGCLSSIDTANGQIIPDNSLGAEKSVVNTINVGIPVDLIYGGATRGKNLFHSFREFNVGEGRGTAFYNPTGIENILSRVTGKNPSNIFGLLGVLGNANLFFINPNGIIFGPNARLYVNGSFLASTANSLVFDNNFKFSATNPQTPPMLTVNIPIGLQFRDNPGSITNQSVAVDNSDTPVGLQVPSGNFLALVGGNISLNGGIVTVRGGRVELGGLAGAGTVGLSMDGNNLRLSYPMEVQRADVLLLPSEQTYYSSGLQVSNINTAKVDVTSGDGGSITINARNVDLSKSYLNAGIARGLGRLDNKAGNIEINATDNVRIDGSEISNTLAAQASGNAGDIFINTRSLSLFQGGVLDVSTSGRGNAGNVTINATESVSFDGLGDWGNPSAAYSRVHSGAVGNGGNINIKAGSLSLTNGGLLQTLVESAFTSLYTDNSLPAGQGNAGNVNIDVRDQITFVGQREEKDLQIAWLMSGANAGIIDRLRSSGISSFVDVGAVGNGGDINIKAGSLSLIDGAQINASNFGQGDAGNVNLAIRRALTLGGISTFSRFEGNDKVNYLLNSAILSQVRQNAKGNGDNITINAELLSMTDAAELSTSTFGQSNAGSITIEVNDDVSLTNFSNIRSVVEPGGVGNGGDIKIQTRSLTLTNGSQVVAGVFRQVGNLPGGRGSGGTIEVNASDKVNISGTSSVELPFPVANPLNISSIFQTKGFSSGLLTTAETGSIGQAGNITVNTNAFRVADGAVVGAETENSSNGGSITINAKNFTATGGGQVLTTSRGNGAAGNITLKVADNLTISGNGGNDPNFNQRFEEAKKLGELTDILTNEGAQSGIFANTDEGSTGKGGSIFIDPKQVTIKDRGTITATSAGTGEAGNITLEADNLTLDRGTITAESRNTTGGNINLDIKDLLLMRRNSQISATAGRKQAGGDGGNININSKFIVALPSEDSNITANAFTGRGGNVDISAKGIFGIEPRKSRTLRSDITASSELGITGNVTINTPNADPSHGLVELPKNVVDPTEQIAQNPCQRGVGSKFIITGRGGLPPSPNESTSSDAVRVDLVEPAPVEDKKPGEQRRRGAEEKTKSSVSKPIVPAQGWIFDKNGEVMLTAYDPTGTGDQRSLNSDACPVP
jgi:filamentous hemagglutinin family protein